MPKGYIIGHITVNDPEAYQEYIVRDTPLIEAAGGKPLVRGGEAENAEGPEFARHVIFEFPDFESAKALYYSEEYQDVARIRRENATSMIVLVEGV
ncbi:DUF1330 domain-containing protein [Cognatiyoonia sp. IB215182]|uniref:DUF1330 domain-containing protein n=1 Tax=Cognatiyoonia sp. IB215182 TaxID=3097353 RepID=UPI002A1369B9|nr:DUF1330 domain-containing protein [Cognatiyoonia sp. IB215182]MDX8352423.1 DUF1330 domain-containing protein [Cognatiyoonia sp. IB215182]